MRARRRPRNVEADPGVEDKNGAIDRCVGIDMAKPLARDERQSRRRRAASISGRQSRPAASMPKITSGFEPVLFHHAASASASL